MKRFYAAILVATLLLSVYSVMAHAEGFMPTINVSEETANPGAEVEVEISLANNPGFVTMQLQIEYDEAVFTLKEVRDKGVLGTVMHKPELCSPYTLRWANHTVTENFTVNGPIAVLVFEVGEDAKVGTYPITVSYDYDNYEIINWQMNKVHFDISNSVINVKSIESDDPIDNAISGTALKKAVLEGTSVIVVPTNKDGIAMTAEELGVMLNNLSIEITSNNGKIGTGSKVKIGNNEVELVVKGDIDGDGVITVYDSLMVKKALDNNGFENEILRAFAGDADGTNGTTSDDVYAILSHIVGAEFID